MDVVWCSLQEITGLGGLVVGAFDYAAGGRSLKADGVCGLDATLLPFSGSHIGLYLSR